ncbi:MAG TPA: helix-turn-helix domain-containing protein [Candidatus Saccharimonadales bacterium]|jgi:sugar-specific transcriptional regulator TrmB
MSVPFDTHLFGLEPRDIKVYEAMLPEIEGISIRALADKTKMNRGTVFEVVKKLVQSGTVTCHYKLSRKYYVAQDPAFLEKYAEERALTIESELAKVRSYVNQLETVQSATDYGRFSQLYEGEDEIVLLLQDVLETVAQLPDKTYRVVSSAEVSNHLYKKFENFTRRRIKLGITARVIGVGGSDELRPLAERKWLSSEQTPECYLIIYGNKVAQISLSRYGKVQGSVIQNPGVAQLQGLLFDNLWDKL